MEFWKQAAVKQAQFDKLIEPLQEHALMRRIRIGEATGRWDSAGMSLGHTAQSQRFQ